MNIVPNLTDTYGRVQRFIENKSLYLLCGATVIFISLLFLLASVSSERKRTTKPSALPASFVSNQGEQQPVAHLIYVDVAGAVIKPGVYQLPQDSRLEQAIIAAGGFAVETVDADYIAKELNLASKLRDGQKVYIAHKGEDRSKIPLMVSGSVQEPGKINLNSASLSELNTLSGVGDVTARKIMDNRPYESIDQLLTKKVVSQSVYAKIVQSVTTGS